MKPEEVLIKYYGQGSPLTIQGPTTGFKKSQPSIKIASCRGDVDNPKVIENGDQIGVLKFTAYTGADGESFVNSAFISAVVTDKNIFPGKKEIDSTLMLGSIKSIHNGNYVTIDPNGVLSAPKILLNFDQNSIAIRDTTKDWWLAGGTNYDYEAPFTINTKSTGIKINQEGNFKQPTLTFNSYTDNPFKAGWMSFNRFRGTQENPQPCRNGDFIYAFDWMGKSCKEDPWEWGMAQTAILDSDPSPGHFPVSMNWVTRDKPFSKPEVRVKISSNGTLTAYQGIVIKNKLDLNLQEISVDKIDVTKVRYFKVNLNGVDCVIPVHDLIQDEFRPL
jgi:hypothetical protein